MVPAMSSPRRHRALAVLSLALACQPKEPEAPTTAPSVGDPQLHSRMKKHFSDATAVKDAVSDGDLGSIHALAQQVVEQEEPQLYAMDWRPHVVRFVEVADSVREAPDVPAAAVRTAQLAATCGHCHQTVHARPQLPDEPAPQQGIMAHHQWAADRMWEGIIGPSETAWYEGTKAFVQAPGCGVDPDDELSDYMTVLCEQLHGLAARADAAKELDDRAIVYGDFLTTCAACHHAGP